jgi:hypothetical protein
MIYKQSNKMTRVRYQSHNQLTKTRRVHLKKVCSKKAILVLKWENKSTQYRHLVLESELTYNYYGVLVVCLWYFPSYLSLLCTFIADLELITWIKAS